jgi:hypothetical protein
MLRDFKNDKVLREESIRDFENDKVLRVILIRDFMLLIGRLEMKKEIENICNSVVWLVVKK